MSAFAINLRKDLRRLTPWLIGWAALLIARFVLQLASLAPAQELTVFLSITFILYWVFTVLVAAEIVLEDPPCGTTAFWLTRPLRRSAIAWEKIALLAALVVIPAVLDLAGMAWMGASPAMLAVAGINLLITQAPCVLVAAAFATTAEALGRFLLNLIFTLIGIVIVTLVLSVWAALNRHLPPFAVPIDPFGTMTRVQSQQIATELLFGGAALCVLAWSYVKPRARPRLALVAILAFAVTQVAGHWTWNFVADMSRPRTARTPHATALDGALHYQSHFAFAALSTPEPEEGALPIPLWPGQNLVLTDARGERRLRYRAQFSLPSADRLWPEGLVQALAPATLLNRPDPAFITIIAPRLGSDGEMATRLSGSVEIGLCRFIREAELPLDGRSRANFGLRHLEAPAPAGGASREIALDESRLESPFASAFAANFDIAGPVWIGRGDPPPTWGDTHHYSEFPAVYVVVNRRRNEAIVLETIFTRQIVAFQGFQKVRLTLGAQFSPEMTEDWLRDATLVRYRFAEVARIQGTFAP